MGLKPLNVPVILAHKEIRVVVNEFIYRLRRKPLSFGAEI